MRPTETAAPASTGTAEAQRPLAKVIPLDAIERSLRAAERYVAETIPCGPPERFTLARLSDDGEDRILLQSEDCPEVELTEGAALALSHHLYELVRVKRAARGLGTP